MNIEATAEALAPEQAVQVPEATPEAPSMDDELGALWDKAQETPETDDQTPDEPVEAKTTEEQPVEEPEAAPEKVENKPTDKLAPDIPRQLREHWSKFPEESRVAVEDFAREMNRKLAEQGRLVHGISPIRDALTDAVKDFPQLADMKPHEVAKEVFELAKISAQFNTKPVETMIGLIRKHGLEKQIQQAMSGQQVSDNVTPLRQEIAQLKRQLSQYADPEYIRNQVSAVTNEQQTVSAVQEFASTAEHWTEVEDHLPAYVQLMRSEMGQDASAKDVLKAAYDLAVSRIVPPEPKAPAQASDQDADVVDPEKAKAALKAKSVNVRSQPSKPKPMTEDELLEAVWDKSHKR